MTLKDYCKLIGVNIDKVRDEQIRKSIKARYVLLVTGQLELGETLKRRKRR